MMTAIGKGSSDTSFVNGDFYIGCWAGRPEAHVQAFGRAQAHSYLPASQCPNIFHHHSREHAPGKSWMGSTLTAASSTCLFFLVGLSKSKRVRRVAKVLRAVEVTEVKMRQEPISRLKLFSNGVQLMIAELPGPWEQWRQKRRAIAVRDLDLIEAKHAEEEAPLSSITEERRAAGMGNFTAPSERFPENAKRKVKVKEPLGKLPVSERRRIVIIGAGPSGYTAAMYTARAKLRPLLFCGELVGGQLMLTSDIENFPGYPEAVSGPQMMQDLREQAERFGAEIREKKIDAVDLSRRPFLLKTQDGDVVAADSLIIATGASARWLHAPGEDAVRGQGVSTCAVCDGALYMGEEVAVVGGGDTAFEDALFLARFASKVTLLHRNDDFKASAVMVERVRREPLITVKPWRMVGKWLHDDTGLIGIEALDPRDDSVKETISCKGAFVAIGHDAQSSLFAGQLALDEEGYILHTRPGHTTMTSIPGVFSCGDVSDRRYRQAVTAAGHGCQSALDSERWLDRVPEVGY